MHRSMKFGLYGLVLAGLLGGTAAWVTADKTVELRIDGQDRKVHTSARDVRAILEAAHVPVGEHDLIAPDLGAKVSDNGHIVVSHGHLLELDVDGHAKQVWVNATSVDEALTQLGYGTQNLVSVSRSKRLDAGATKLTINSPKRVTFKVDHTSVYVASAGPTVSQAIVDSGIVLGPHDRLSVRGATLLRDNEVVTIQRVKYGSQTTEVTVPYATVQKKDPNSYVGTTSTVTTGKDGLKKISWQLVYVDGQLAGRVPVNTTVLSAPVTEQTVVGTKPIPVGTAVPAGAAQQIAAGMVAARGWGTDQFSCLVSLWSKESGWRTDAANSSGAYGIPQALPGSKMSTVGADWQTSATTQITWGLNYISGVYGTPCAAWAHSQASNWY